jgi:hypothetical protein
MGSGRSARTPATRCLKACGKSAWVRSTKIRAGARSRLSWREASIAPHDFGYAHSRLLAAFFAIKLKGGLPKQNCDEQAPASYLCLKRDIKSLKGSLFGDSRLLYRPWVGSLLGSLPTQRRVPSNEPTRTRRSAFAAKKNNLG